MTIGQRHRVGAVGWAVLTVVMFWHGALLAEPPFGRGTIMAPDADGGLRVKSAPALVDSDGETDSETAPERDADSGNAPGSDKDADSSKNADSAEPIDPRLTQALTAAGLAPDGDGAADYLSRYLASLGGDPKSRDLIEHLGDPDYDVRHRATAELLRLPLAPLSALRAARSSSDPEVAYRVEWILSRAEPTRKALLRTCWRMLATDPRPAALDDVFRTAAADGAPDTLRIAGQAVKALVGAAMRDTPAEGTASGPVSPDEAASPDAVMTRLQAALKPDQPVLIRRLAIVGTEALEPSAREPILVGLLTDERPEIQLDAISRLAQAADRRVLAPLVELLESGDGETRGRAFWLLYALTQQTSGYSPYGKSRDRRAAVATWRQWLATEGATLELQPLGSLTFSGRGSLSGHTLIATGSNQSIHELNTAGEKVFNFRANAWSAEKLPNGNILIADHDGGRVIEVDFHTEKVVWEKGSLNPMSVKPLVNGHVLVADFSSGRVVELGLDHEIVWQAGGHESCFDVDRLPNGNTLVGCPNYVREITPANETVREWKIDDRLNGFHLQPDGNILVANWGAKEIQEYAPGGEIVWRFSFKEFGEGPCDVFRLPDGSCLITTDRRVVELGADRTTLTELEKASYGSARR